MVEITFLRKEGGRKRDRKRTNIFIFGTCNVQKRKKKKQIKFVTASLSMEQQSQYYVYLRLPTIFSIIFHGSLHSVNSARWFSHGVCSCNCNQMLTSKTELGKVLRRVHLHCWPLDGS